MTDPNREEMAHLQTIDERDEAQEFASQVYYQIIGRSPEWSNLFHFPEALEEIMDAVNALKLAVRDVTPREGLESFSKEIIRLGWDGAVDGGDVQEAAIKYGLIVPAKYDPAKHGENVEADVGDDIYEFASALSHPSPPDGGKP
jgi:hypothetical protein